MNDLLQQLDASLSGLVPAQRVECHGAWSTTLRRTYAAASQLGSGAGPYVEVIDARWSGAVTAEVEISAIVFLATARETFWAKASEVSLTLPVQILLSAHADSTPDRATFTASLGGAVLPGVPIGVEGRLEDVCALGPEVFMTGRVTCLAETRDAAFLAVVLSREVLKVGRNRLWRVREEVAAQLPATMRELLTRRRAGTLTPNSSAGRTDGAAGASSREESAPVPSILEPGRAHLAGALQGEGEALRELFAARVAGWEHPFSHDECFTVGLFSDLEQDLESHVAFALVEPAVHIALAQETQARFLCAVELLRSLAAAADTTEVPAALEGNFHRLVSRSRSLGATEAAAQLSELSALYRHAL